MGRLQNRPGKSGTNVRPVSEPLERRALFSATYYVSPIGNDASTGLDADDAWRTVQQAFNAAPPGSTVNVLAGTYKEKPTVNVSGNETDGFITFQAAGKVVISGKNVAGPNIITINNHDYVRIIGFELRDNVKTTNGSGIRLTEANDHVEIRNNKIYNITGANAMGITVYGTEPTRGISNLVIDGNEIYKCQAAPSEALVLNGNVHDFSVSNNRVHDVKGIGMDFIGGEGMSRDAATDSPRNGTVSGNRVSNAKFKGGHFAAGINVDGARDIVIEKNFSCKNDIGIQVGCVDPALTASNITVRNNVVSRNVKTGIAIGGAFPLEGTVNKCTISNNTIYDNGSVKKTGSELWLETASGNRIENNVICGGKGAILDAGGGAALDNVIDHNLYYASGNATKAAFTWQGVLYKGIDAYRAVSGQDAGSIFANPLIANAKRMDFRLLINSPAINAGKPEFIPAIGETDLSNATRILGGRIDIGAYEVA